jgi:hypothetical protein
MANLVYGKAKTGLLNGLINTSASQYALLLVDKSLYSINELTDEFVSDIPTLAIKKRTENISGITVVNGVLDANDLTIIHDGSYFDAIICYQIAGTDAGSRLFFYIDSSIGLPYSGSNSSSSITIIWSNTVSKILSI